MTPHRGQQGFTLIELVVAITLLAAMMAILTGGFSLSLRSWEAGTRRMERHYDIAEGACLIAGNVKEARGVFYIDDKNIKTLAFTGNGTRLSFVTSRPRLLSPSADAGLYLQKVEYNSAKKAVVFSEAPFYPRTPPEEMRFTSAAFGEGMVDGLHFEYLVRDPDPAQEKYVWSTEVDYFNNRPPAGREQWMPRAVRIKLATPAGERGPPPAPALFARIMPGTEIKKAGLK